MKINLVNLKKMTKTTLSSVMFKIALILSLGLTAPVFLQTAERIVFQSNKLRESASLAFTQMLREKIAERREKVAEFVLIREAAQELGIRVWLFGGTASGFGHYVEWDLLRKAGDTRYIPSCFDYDFTNIYRSTQDADLVIDGSVEDAERLENLISQKIPHLEALRSKSIKASQISRCNATIKIG